jgi:RNA polymerase primary sigma factor/RNA polymerase sigma factor
MNQIEKFHQESLAVKNEIVRANLRLVVSIAKRYMNRSHDFFELVSDGNLALIRAAEKFDFARGHKFSTYASWAIMHSLSRSVPNEIRRRDRFRTSHGELFDNTEDTRTNQGQKESSLLKCQTQVKSLLRHLDKRERTIIDRRFGLADGRKPVTLKQLGAEIGVTSERVRQLEARAIGKLRRAAESEGVEFPEF